MDKRLTHLVEQLEAVDADPNVEHDPAEPIIDQVEDVVREIRRTAREVLERDDD
jgi:hypothetical protein